MASRTTKNIFACGVRRLVNRSNKCVEMIGDYNPKNRIFVLAYLLYNEENNAMPLLHAFRFTEKT